MPKNEDGEFELILGNRQLLSVFFIVVILLGVFFTMGYIVGRNSAPVLPAEPVTARKGGDTPGKPIVVEPAGRPSPSSVESKTVQPEATPASTQPEVKTPPERKPAAPEHKPAAAVAPPTRQPVRPVTQAAVKEPQTGQTYLQLAATGHDEAKVLVGVLGEKGFHALVAPGPNEKLFRVLVGPMKDAAQITQIRDDLVKYGFKGREAIAKKY